MLELAHTLDAVPQTSPLAEARERRDLSIKQVAYRSGLTEAEIEWLEEGRIYRFPSQNAAMLAAVVYATALGIDRFDYPKTTVYYGPGGAGVGVRLARQLSVASEETPGLTPTQLLVIAGPQTVATTG